MFSGCLEKEEDGNAPEPQEKSGGKADAPKEPGDSGEEEGPGGSISQSSSSLKLALGDYHSCAITSINAVKCWGNNSKAELGDNDASKQDKNYPVDVVGGSGVSTALTNITQISSHSWHTCTLTTSGMVQCWGENSFGQLGNDSPVFTGVGYPVTVVDGDGSSVALSNITQVEVGALHTCALSSSNSVKCWGDGSDGRLGKGNGNNDEVHYPIDVVDGDGSSTALTGVAQISLGNLHSCVLTTTGTVKCWGDGSDGRLGNDGTANKDYPVDVVDGNGSTTALSNIAAISSGDHHTCALTTTGRVKCWGKDQGRLGSGDASNQSSDHPLDVIAASGSSSLLANIVQISAKGAHTCALTSSGTVKCWGEGSSGELGNDANTDTAYPVDVIASDGGSTALSGVQEISTGGNHTCARLTSNKVKCWGKGDDGQLGNDFSLDRNYPVDVVIGSESSTPLVL